ncbi:hypothetical protein ACFSO7_03375 [Bacillus sp. CGMCC 1.16607]
MGELAKMMEISIRTVDYYPQSGVLDTHRTDSKL